MASQSSIAEESEPATGSDTAGGSTRASNVVGSYQLERPIGDGSTCEVYLARNGNRRKVALKILASHLSHDPIKQHRFVNEIRMCRKVRHPNLLRMLDAGQHAGRPYLVSELLVGGTAERYIHGGGFLPAPLAAHYVQQLCCALSYLHSRGIVHRDVKPENLMVSSKGQVTLIDFGLAMHTEELRVEGRVTTEGFVAGTPEYLSPEQALGRTLTGATDVFSAGLVLYELITGCHPFDGSAQEIARQNAFEPVPGFRQRNRLISDPHLEQLTLRMLRKSPEARPRASEVAETLRTFCSLANTSETCRKASV